MFSYDSNPLDVFPGFELVRRHPKSRNYLSLYLKEKLEREIRDWDWKMDWLSRSLDKWDYSSTFGSENPKKLGVGCIPLPGVAGIVKAFFLQPL